MNNNALNPKLIWGLALAAFFLMSFLPTSLKGPISVINQRHVSEELLFQRLDCQLSVVNLDQKDKVNYYTLQYLNSRKRGAEILLGRAPQYLPVFSKMIREKGLPMELAYIPVIESALKSSATSSRGAGGLWQLMPPLARKYGLTVNRNLDERRDLYKSTEAALSYLNDLHAYYDDWSLAIAAYNCGTPRMDKAIRLAGSRDYRDIARYLPKETQHYLPKIMAACYILNNYQYHDIVPDYPDPDKLFIARVQVSGETTLAEMAEKAQIDEALLRKLNPAYRNGEVPNTPSAQFVMVPKGKEKIFLP